MLTRWTVAAVLGVGAAMACGGSASGGDGSGGSAGAGASGGSGGTSGGSGNGGSSTGGSGGVPTATDCERVCNGLVDCPNAPPPDEVQRCVGECTDLVVPRECEGVWRDFISCAEAEAARCRDPEACQSFAEQLLECTMPANPCAGLSSSGFASPEGSFEVTEGPCECMDPDGAPAGSACTSSSDCAPVCCNCGSPAGAFFGAGCVRGRCASGDVVCDRITMSDPTLCGP